MQRNQWIVDEAVRAKKQGIRIDVGGVSYNEKSREALARVLQKGNYMLDYEGDALGHIVALHIDKVSKVEEPSYKSLRCTKK